MRVNLNVGRILEPARDQRRGLVLAGLAAGIIVLTQAASALDPGSSVAAGSTAQGASQPADQPVNLQPAANRLRAQYQTNLQALAALGQAGLSQGRNEATVADFLGLRSLIRLDAMLERYGRLLGATDASQLALGVAGVQHYSELIHDGLLSHGPGRLIVVSLAAQHLLAYDHGRVIVDTPVTTGRAALPTDVGAMHIVHKDAPWTMHSPWPKGSPNWYPDTQVAMVAWFTTTGEGLHDAAWEPNSAYGPGSENGPYASHGCIHLPPAAEAVLFPWASLGTPVVVYPGDGSDLASQAAQRTVDASGAPMTGVRGD